MRLVLLGPPGAGKGTQANKISKKFGILHISTGEILRSEINRGSPLGKKAYCYVNEGKLVPDRIILGIIKDKIGSKEATNGFLMDGFPRNLKQAKMLSKMLDGLEMKLDRVINIEVDEDEIIKRLNNRRVCSSCGKIYRLGGDIEVNERECRECGGELKKRSDDEIDVVMNRLKVYEKETKPLIDYYASKGLLLNVDGKGSEKEITERIINGL